MIVAGVFVIIIIIIIIYFHSIFAYFPPCNRKKVSVGSRELGEFSQIPCS